MAGAAVCVGARERVGAGVRLACPVATVLVAVIVLSSVDVSTVARVLVEVGVGLRGTGVAVEGRVTVGGLVAVEAGPG